ncbi:oligosaccharide flippase family protein [Candidatus Woesearchaeota archaeon]|nr:oligosaccharide flippase family protein [Candidatus Woesearchaeota archaeon]
MISLIKSNIKRKVNQGIEKVNNLSSNFYNGGETSGHLIKTFILYGLIALSIIITKVLIARLYGQIELGIFSYFFSIVTIAFLFTSLGFPEAITQIIIKHPGKLKNALLKGIYFIISISIVVLALVTIPKSLFAAPGLKVNFLLYLIVYTFFYLTYSILRGFKKFTECSIYSLVNRVAFIIFIVIFALYSISFDWLLASMSLALFIAGVIALPSIVKLWKSNNLIEKETEKTDIVVKDAKVDTKKLAYLAISLFLMQTGFYLLRETDTILIPYLAGFEQQAIYSAQSSISNIIRLIAYVFPVVILPMAAVSKYKIKQSLTRILKLLLPFSVLILVLTYIAIPIIYGSQYADKWLPIALVISSTLMVIYSYFNSILVGENKFSKQYFKLVFIDFLITLMVNTGLTILFVKWWGILGAPIATTLTVLLKIALNVYGISKLRSTNQIIEMQNE